MSKKNKLGKKQNKKQVSENYEQDISRIKAGVLKYGAELNNYMNFKGFDALLEKIFFEMSEIIKLTMKSKKPCFKKGNLNIDDVKSFLFIVTETLEYKFIPKEYAEVIKDILLLMKNWFALLDHYKIHKLYNTNIEQTEYLKKFMYLLYQNLTGVYTFETLTEMTNRLIKKAEELLAVEPPAFQLSKHYMEAIKLLDQENKNKP